MSVSRANEHESPLINRDI
jgi:hypothetical protein